MKTIAIIVVGVIALFLIGQLWHAVECAITPYGFGC